jgi:hypothetical protein
VSLTTFIPISEEVLADGSGFSVGAFVQRAMGRALTAESFGERWSSAEAELERLELGQVVAWDSLTWDDEDDA